MEKETEKLAEKIFNELNPCAEWKFEAVAEDVETEFHSSAWEDEEDLHDAVEEVLTQKLAGVLCDGYSSVDEDDCKDGCGEWACLIMERGEKFATEKEIFENAAADAQHNLENE